PSRLADLLPPSIEEIVSPVCVLFVGSSPPTAEWLCEHEKSLAVNATCIGVALQWLKLHKPLYKDIKLNESCLQRLEADPVLPFSIENIRPNTVNEAATSRYDSSPRPDSNNTTPTELTATIPFRNVVIADVDFHASSNELRAAALCHVKKKGGGYVQIPHGRDTANKFKKDGLLVPMIYPTLFPYGMGGPE
ncbi:hypothetical protein B0H17DRAFT_899369, partial [Mycena rosella]